jgi:hypothetical protein
VPKKCLSDNRAFLIATKTKPMTISHAGPLGAFIRTFYDARRTASRAGDMTPLTPFIAPDVRWTEPQVGDHMGKLEGRDAVLDMIGRALATTGGSFDLRVEKTIETGIHVAALIDWSADKKGQPIAGQGRN